jgi:prolyl-tRNA editing enzyme YbaK/EbsC (Cys-tRNA(Pro) deacylase)
LCIALVHALGGTLPQETTPQPPGQIAKTLSLWLRQEVVLLMMGGDARIDNQKFKAQFQTKPKMLSAEHKSSCRWCVSLRPAARAAGFADITLKKFAAVLPAAGETNAAVRISPERLVQLVNATWGTSHRAALEGHSRHRV